MVHYKPLVPDKEELTTKSSKPELKVPNLDLNFSSPNLRLNARDILRKGSALS